MIPRAHRAGCEASVPIDQLLLPVLRRASRGVILLTAEPGGGRTTALRHLGAVLPTVAQVLLFDADEEPPEEIRKACLCGVNLIGAEVEGTDFYLVDRRGASIQKRRPSISRKPGRSCGGPIDNPPDSRKSDFAADARS